MRDWLKRLMCALVMIPLTIGWVMILVVYEPSPPLWLKMAATLLLCLLIVLVSWLCSEPVSFLRSMLLLALFFSILFSTLVSSLDTVVYTAVAALIFYSLGLILLTNHPESLFNKTKWEVMFMVINLILEAALVVLTGMIALKKHNSPLLATAVSFGALSVCIIEICYKAANDPEGFNYLKRHGLVGLSQRPFYKHPDFSSSICVALQFISSCIQYNDHRQDYESLVRDLYPNIIFFSFLVYVSRKFLLDSKTT